MVFRLPTFSPVAWITISKVTQQTLWLILFAVLAPILGPRPYGLFSIVMVFVGFCELVLIEGATEALITVGELDPLHTSTANLVNGVLAVGCGLVMAVLAPAIGMVFHDDEIVGLVWALAPLPVLSALSATPVALLRRSLQYKQLAVRSIVGLAIGGIFGIVLAIEGAGVWALALQVLAQRLAEVTIAWMSVPTRLSFRWSVTHFQEMKAVGMNVFAAQMLNFASGQLPRMILGYALGPTELGLFTLATRIADIIVGTTIMPCAAVGRVELKASKPGSLEFGRIFSEMTQSASVLAFPLFLGTAALAPDLFRLWLGQSWLAGTIPAQLILLGGLPFAFFFCIDAALLAANLSSVYRRLAAIQTLTVIATVLCAAPFGLELTCLALAIRSWLLLPVFLLLIQRSCHLSVYDFVRLPVRSLTGAVVMASILMLPLLRPLWLGREFDFILLIIIGVIFYGLFLYGFSRGQLTSLLTGYFVRRPDGPLTTAILSGSDSTET